ncbi:M15 family metallopeptidase [Galbibacter sp. EGI 63066]|uniref:M15 family metallopeptidase n=1 Tax=Galbibacter sp. EGI 63066 TaxID=2993559 RepID=UPI002248ACB2|nr:M15 family metallopeptidase [Galbibacter sp. EGI 63066]MCX2679191.1 M15 family metallopeptidase [Galbibacter sp. EGI 63066]
MRYYLLMLLAVGFVVSCKSKTEKSVVEETVAVDTIIKVEEELASVEEEAIPEPTPLDELNDTVFVRLADYSDDFVYEMKYATTDNFLEAQVYECGECYVRAVTAKALIETNKDFMEQGYRIKFFDCYRPHDVQKKMWKIVPNPTYVADPAKGSIHNKGGAVDITLTDLDGNELDMGTSFDFFGREARHAYQNLDEEVLKNRKTLKATMESHGFGSITSEWWHYNYRPTLGYNIANFTWECE